MTKPLPRTASANESVVYANKTAPPRCPGDKRTIMAQRRRASSGAGVETLPPEPLQSSSLSLHPMAPSAPSEPPSSKSSTAPSLLALLQATHRYSSYVLSGFVGLHALNTSIIPLTTLLSSETAALSTIDNGFMITRYLYRPSRPVEIALVFAPLGIHVLAGTILRIYRIFQQQALYGEGILAQYSRQSRINRAQGLSWPRLRALSVLGFSTTAASGWTTLFFVSLHAYTTRFLPLTYGTDGETSVTIVSYALQKHPILVYTLYYGLIASASFHILSGWGRWLKVTVTQRGEQLKNYVVYGVVTAWTVSLVRIGSLKIFSWALKGEYDSLYRRLWSGF
jgi:hypothetical protein